jgi:hypothetical protein
VDGKWSAERGSSGIAEAKGLKQKSSSWRLSRAGDRSQPSKVVELPARMEDRTLKKRAPPWCSEMMRETTALVMPEPLPQVLRLRGEERQRGRHREERTLLQKTINRDL